MNLVDSCGWIEFFIDGPLAGKYSVYIKDRHNLATSPVVIYEVYKLLKRERCEEEALEAIAHISSGKLLEITQETVLIAADASLEYGIPMADAIVYASGIISKSRIITGDKHFKNLPNVVYLSA